MNRKNFKIVFILYFIVFGIIISLFGTMIGYKIQLTDIKERTDISAEEIAYIKKINTLKPDLEKMDTILLALSNDKTLREYIKSPNATNKIHTENVFYAISLSDRQVMQARFINAHGKEQIRIDRSSSFSLPFIVEPSKLQDKSGRDYFRIVSTLKPGVIWHSKIDLNIEHGKIEVPFKPTFRIATPIYNEGTFQGIVIVNVLMDDILSKIAKSTVFEHYIIDKDGNFILHPDERFSWSKYTGSKVTLLDAFPLDAHKILSGAAKGGNFYAYSLDDILHNGDDARLILKPKAEYLRTLTRSNIQTSVFVVLLSVLLSIPLAIYASIAPSRLQKALWTSNNDLRRFADIIDKYVITVTTKTDSSISAVSSAYTKISGYSKEELIGQTINIVQHPDTPSQVYQELWETVERGKEWKGELKNRRKDGEAYWLEQTIIPVTDENGNPVSYMSVGIDIGSKKELEILSTTDRLTGIFNRRKLDEVLHHEADIAKRYERPLSVMLIDIDHFKKVNDTYGHQTGDYALQKVAALLKENLRNTDTLGRLGGEEFMVICPESDETSAAALGEKLRSAIEDYRFETLSRATISIGVAQLTPFESVDEWVEQADKALYKAKEGGRNRVMGRDDGPSS